MNRTNRLLHFVKIILVLCIFISIPIVTRASSIDSSEITKRISADIDKVNETTDYMNGTKDEAGTIVGKLSSYKDYFNASAKYYQDNANNVDESLKPVLTNAKIADETISSGLGTMVDSFKNGDENTYNRGLENYNSGIEKLNQVAKQHDQALGIYNPGPTYIWLSIIFSIISFVLFVKSQAKIVGDFSRAKREVMLGLFKSSLWPTIGSLVTTIWYYSTPPGEKYFILWGPMLIGFIYFVRALLNYIKIRKPLKISVKAEYSTWRKEEEKKRIKAEKEAEKPSTNMMYCPYCGFQHEKADKFCSSCGKKL